MNSIRSHLIRVNMLCNEKCSFCNVTEETEPYFREKSIREILISVAKIIKDSEDPDSVKITLSWGEPTLRKDLVLIVKWIKKLWVKYLEIQTNATLLNPLLTRELITAWVNKFFISFHSHEKEIFEDYVWLKWIFDIVVGNIKNLWNYGHIEVILNPVISSKNHQNLKWYFNFIKKEFPFIVYISFSFIQPHWEAKENMNLMLNYETVNNDLAGILDYAFSLWFILNNPYCWLPVCVLNWRDYTAHCIEIAEAKPFLEHKKIRKESNKVYLEECNGCVFKWLCWGVWKEYKELFGSRWIKSISSNF